MGRTYEHKILDIVELGLVNYTSIFDITNNCQVPIFCQPFVMFQGDLWETVDEFKKLRNLLHDFFYANQHAKGIEISKAMKVVVCFTITEDRRIHLQVYETAVDSKRLLEEDCKITI